MKLTRGKVSVLLLDADPHDREAVRGNLIRLGFDVISVSTDIEAISTLCERPDIRVVVFDAHDPGKPVGLDLALYIKESCPATKLVITSRVVRFLHPCDIPDDSCFLPFPIPADTFLQETYADVHHSYG